MSLYVCDRCGCVENTALSNYWRRIGEGKKNRLCSECDPSIGAWHGRFPKETWDGKRVVIWPRPSEGDSE